MDTHFTESVAVAIAVDSETENILETHEGAGTLRVVSVWTKTNGLDKDKVRSLSHQDRWFFSLIDIVFLHPMLDRVELKLSNSAKYLEIFLGRKLMWKENIEERRKKDYIAWFACSK
uniref:Uncharacterized protein n=1 Tax=Megaselia scalaris TaxID=36166 RepID=T1GPA0_MEGSC